MHGTIYLLFIMLLLVGHNCVIVWTLVKKKLIYMNQYFYHPFFCIFLQVVDVPMIENRECERWHRDKGINVIIYDEMICAGYYGGGKDSCQGDSGGPLMTEIEGRWTLIGIVSAGYSCAKRGQPGIYHRVAQTSDWISYSINDQKNKKKKKTLHLMI